MHDLKPMTALGGIDPRIDTFDHIVITEQDELALASVAARLGKEDACETKMMTVLGGIPAAGKALFGKPEAGFWMGPHQWMISAPIETHEGLADQLKNTFADTASITEQSGAWVCFDLTGPAMEDMCERLCAVPIRAMVSGDAQRSVIHQLGCFVIRMEAKDHLRIFGPRASAATLHHALVTAAHSTA